MSSPATLALPRASRSHGQKQSHINFDTVVVLRMRKQILHCWQFNVAKTLQDQDLGGGGMSLSVFVTYEPDGSPQMSVRTEKRLNLMVSS